MDTGADKVTENPDTNVKVTVPTRHITQDEIDADWIDNPSNELPLLQRQGVQACPVQT